MSKEVLEVRTRCTYSECGQLFDVVWGRGSGGNRRSYCCLGHRLKGRREKQKAREKAPHRRRIKYAKNLKDRQATKGRICKWKHCLVDDEFHVDLWNSGPDVCPSCYRQRQRVGLCGSCSGPLYKSSRRRNSIYCPTCEPITPNCGEVSITLVCSVTGRERQIVRSKRWKLPNGILLHSIANFGFAVIDLEPKVWARFRV